VVQTKVEMKSKTLILCPVRFFESSAVYEIMSKNMVEPEGPQMTSQYGLYALNAGYARPGACIFPCAGERACTHRQTYDTFYFPRQQLFANAPQCYVIVHSRSC
jgi:hypothetical protein